MKLEEMEKVRIAKGYSYSRIAEMVGMTEVRVRKILQCYVDHLYLEDAFALEVALTESYPPTREKVAQIVNEMLKLPEGWEEDEEETLNSGYIREKPAYWIESAARKRQGEYTLEDYYLLPDETMPYVEMINGVIYSRLSPSKTHQIIVRELITDIVNYIRKKKGKCQLFPDPFDTIISNNTLIKPDILVICNDDKLSEDGIQGAPDFVIEVLSKSTKTKDLKKKLPAYREAGVRECWMIDPEYEKVIVYRFEEKAGPTIYGFNDVIPVEIYLGDLQIDFGWIREVLSNAGHYV